MSIAEQSFARNALIGKEPENVSFLLILQFMHVFELPQIDTNQQDRLSFGRNINNFNIIERFTTELHVEIKDKHEPK